MFCRKCGEELRPNIRFCHKCGTKVISSLENSGVQTPVDTQVNIIPPDKDISTTSENKTSKNTKKKKYQRILIISAIIAFISIFVLLFFLFIKPLIWPADVDSKAEIITQDINQINGAPEFFGLEFGMSLEEASRLITTEHQTFKGFPPSKYLSGQDSYIMQLNVVDYVIFLVALLALSALLGLQV